VRADRLLSIMLLLQVNERMTAADLAGRLSVSERTIFRDMDALSSAGIPVVAERGTGGGWRLVDGYRTRLTGLTAEEVQSLFFARPPDALADLGLGDASESAWLKLRASLGDRGSQQAAYVHERFLVDSTGWRDASNVSTVLPKLLDALWRNRQARFQYESALHQAGERLVHPLGLVAKGSVWYLVAQREGELRTYRVSRIGSVRVEDAAAVRPQGFDLTAYWQTSSSQFREQIPPVIATYLARPRALRWVRYKGWRVLEQIEEGARVRLRVRFDSDEEAVQLALAHGGDIELVEPAALRAVVCDTARQTLEAYGG
jgi:predicted DNA-binding transcriptional regulator YafY